MEHVLGLASLLLVGTLVAWLAMRCASIALALFVAFAVRASAALFHFYVTALPDGTTDARSLENTAWRWGNDGLATALGHFTGPDSHFYSWLLALVYSVTGRSPLMAQAFSVLAGVGTVYLTWRLTSELWGERHARKAVWCAALFPTLVLYSALTLREAYIVFFVLLGLWGTVRWARREDVYSLLGALAGFGLATFFHGGMFIALAAFLGLFAARHGYKWLAALRRARIRLFSTVLLVAVFVGTASYIVIGFDLPKLGKPSELVNAHRLVNRFEFSQRGTASYPDWAVPQEGSEIIWKAPIRIVYFLFAPFSWDIEKLAHLVGWFDGLLYMIIVFFLWRGRKQIIEDEGGRSVLLVLAALVLVFGLAISNFGTGLRHRAKFVAGFIALIAPRLPRLVARPVVGESSQQD